MAPMKATCFAVGMMASSAAASVVPPNSIIYRLQGGGSGLEQDGDYIENKIARGVYGVFGAAAEEARHAPEHMRDAAASVRETARESGKHVKDAARSVRDSANSSGRQIRDSASNAKDNVDSRLSWPNVQTPDVDFDVDVEPKSWIGAGTPQILRKKNPVARFIANPNNAFVAQGVVSLVFGLFHFLNYNEFGAKLAEPLCNLIGFNFVEVLPVLPHIKIVGAYLVGTLVSDIIAYKSTSAGFKRGKIWHEMGATIAMTAVCFQEVFKADFPPDIMPHCLTALLFSIWFGYLSREY